MKLIPGTDEKLPVIGMGTWQTFNVGGDRELRNDRTRVLEAHFDAGGGMIDSSPMYGSAQAVLGYGLEKLGMPDTLFSADKVWTRDGDATREQAAESRELWNVDRFDLMQVHNLIAWREHLPTLREMKDDGRIRYVGITTSHGRRHADVERILRNEPIDFVQLTYNLTHRRVEDRLLPLAQDRGIAVIANRPFDGGQLVKGIQRAGHPLPPWAKDIGCDHWPAFLLKFIVSHPAVTCAIPATTRVEHMKENKQAELGPMPDAKTRQRMVRYVEGL
ncbi:MAG: aldo/keto reductase [Phycisphaeraceae bacterium]